MSSKLTPIYSGKYMFCPEEDIINKAEEYEGDVLLFGGKEYECIIVNALCLNRLLNCKIFNGDYHVIMQTEYKDQPYIRTYTKADFDDFMSSGELVRIMEFTPKTSYLDELIYNKIQLNPKTLSCPNAYNLAQQIAEFIAIICKIISDDVIMTFDSKDCDIFSLSHGQMKFVLKANLCMPAKPLKNPTDFYGIMVDNVAFGLRSSFVQPTIQDMLKCIGFDTDFSCTTCSLEPIVTNSERTKGFAYVMLTVSACTKRNRY